MQRRLHSSQLSRSLGFQKRLKIREEYKCVCARARLYVYVCVYIVRDARDSEYVTALISKRRSSVSLFIYSLFISSLLLNTGRIVSRLFNGILGFT